LAKAAFGALSGLYAGRREDIEGDRPGIGDPLEERVSAKAI
jgi:hypothetical protein